MSRPSAVVTSLQLVIGLGLLRLPPARSGEPVCEYDSQELRRCGPGSLERSIGSLDDPLLNNTQSTTSVANPATDDSANASLPRVQNCPLDPPRHLASARCACARWPPAIVVRARDLPQSQVTVVFRVARNRDSNHPHARLDHCQCTPQNRQQRTTQHMGAVWVLESAETSLGV